MKKAWLICTMLLAMVFNACTDDDRQAPLQAAFKADKQTALAGEKITFMDQSDGKPQRWDWEFEGGSPATSQLFTPEIAYNIPGTYKVKLTVGHGDNTSTIERVSFITVSYPSSVTADFTCNITSIPRTCLDTEEISFTDASTGVPNEWLWTFTTDESAAVTSTLQNPKLTLEPGVYTVSLRASNPNDNDTKVEREYITVIDHNSVIANFSSPSPRTSAGGSVTFRNETKGNPQSYLWEFEGGIPSSSTEVNPTVTYANSGRYGVKLTSSNAGNSDVREKDGFVIVLPSTNMILYYPLYGDLNDAGPNGLNPTEITVGGGNITFTEDSYAPEGMSACLVSEGGSGQQGGILAVPPVTPYMNGNDSFTIALWSKTSKASTIMFMFQLGIGIDGADVGGTSTSHQSQIWFRYDTNAGYYVRLALAVQGMAGNWTDHGTNPPQPSKADGQWHHYVCVRERNNKGLDDTYIYCDGVLLAKALDKAAKDIAIVPYSIGTTHIVNTTSLTDVVGYKQHLIGNMTDYVHYKGAMSAAEAKALYDLYTQPVP